MANTERNEAVKVALAHIDRSPGAHATNQEQLSFLNELIEKQSLNFNDGTKLRNALLDIFRKHQQTNRGQKKRPGPRIFHEGSVGLKDAYLREIDYDKVAEVAALDAAEAENEDPAPPVLGQGENAGASGNATPSASKRSAEDEVTEEGPPAKRQRTESETTQQRASGPGWRPHARLDVPKLDPDQLRSRMLELWERAGRTRHNALKPLGFDENTTAEIVSEPAELTATKKLNASDLIDSLISFEVYRRVFPFKVPWRTADELLDIIGEDLEHMIEVQDMHGKHQLHIERLVWTAAKYKVVHEDFQANTIKPIAASWVDNLMAAIEQQMQVFEAAGIEGVRRSWDAWTDELVTIFSEALVLKGLMDASPEDYKVEWVSSGGELDRDTMRDLWPTSGVVEVAWCVLPKVFVKWPMKDDWEVGSQATVLSRR